MLFRQLSIFSTLLLATTCLYFTAQAQTANEDWQTLRPEGEEFSISMPKDIRAETSEETYHRMPINARWYVSNADRGPVFAVVSLSGIKSNPAAYTEAQRLTSYVDAFKTFFPARIRKEPVTKLTMVGDKTLNGNQGREYRMTVSDLSGTGYQIRENLIEELTVKKETLRASVAQLTT